MTWEAVTTFPMLLLSGLLVVSFDIEQIEEMFSKLKPRESQLKCSELTIISENDLCPLLFASLESSQGAPKCPLGFDIPPVLAKQKCEETLASVWPS